ncbi:MAG: 5-oxoprolinase subunit PxpB [Synergistaceae bacterium]|nr:5-oxoprolinase subunit PxpB [Synergistaceae bacterium]
MSKLEAKILPAGETCIFVDFGEKIDMKINGYVQALKQIFTDEPFDGLRELVPTYRSLSIYFDPLTVNLDALNERLNKTLSELANYNIGEAGSTEIHVPVFFGGEFGPDLQDVAEHTKLSPDEVIKRYCNSPLYCFMNGFTPGFPYLGGMDKSLETPRLKNPREFIPANSVAIGGAQAGAYSIASPGGWRIIGRVPYELYDPYREPAVAIQAGMWVKFYPVDMSRYNEISEQAKTGVYKIEYRQKGAS